MTLKVTIQTVRNTAHSADPDVLNAGAYPVFYALNDGVNVGQAGELVLTSVVNRDGDPVEFRIYAPGTWKEVNAVLMDD